MLRIRKSSAYLETLREMILSVDGGMCVMRLARQIDVWPDSCVQIYRDNDIIALDSWRTPSQRQMFAEDYFPNQPDLRIQAQALRKERRAARLRGDYLTWPRG